MYVIGVKGARTRIPVRPASRRVIPASPDKEQDRAAVDAREPAAELSHAARPVPLDEGRRLSREERKRGELSTGSWN